MLVLLGKNNFMVICGGRMPDWSGQPFSSCDLQIAGSIPAAAR